MVTRALLGEGDLHPGGGALSERLISLIGPPARVLEVGAGAGLTACRLAAAGWQVTALEPDRELCSLIPAHPSIEVREGDLSSIRGGTWDAVIAESVLFALDPPSAFRRIAQLLSPGGRLAFTDMVWTDTVPADSAASLHDATLAAFGIACASRERLTWADWRRGLGAAGFRILHEERLGAGSPGGPSPRPPVAARQRIRLLPSRIRHAIAVRWLRTPPGWLESWACVAELDWR